MRSIVIIVSLALGFVNIGYAVQSSNYDVADKHMTLSGFMTVEDFISIDFNEYRSADGLSLKWIQRQSLKLYQKKLERKIKNQKLDGSTPLKDVTDEEHLNKRGLISLIFAGLGVIFLFIPGGFGTFGLLFAIAGVILGIIGLKKDEDILLALIGTIVGALVLALYAITLFG